MRRKFRTPLPYYAKHAAQKAAERKALAELAARAEERARTGGGDGEEAPAVEEHAAADDAPPARRRPLFGVFGGVPAWVLLRMPAFAVPLAGLSIAQTERWRRFNVERTEVNVQGLRVNAQVKVFDYETVRPTIGPFAHSLLAVICMLFAAKDFKVPDKYSPLLVSFPLWDFAELLGYDLSLRYPETVNKKGETVMDERDYTRLKALFDQFRKDVRAAMDCLWRLEVPVRFDVEETDVHGRKRRREQKGRSRIISARGDIDDEGSVIVEITSIMARCILQSPLRQIPTAALRLDERAKTAYALSWAMAARYTDSRNHDKRPGAAPDRLRVRTLLTYSALPMYRLDEVLGSKHGWRETFKEPLERALEMLCGHWETRRDSRDKPFKEILKETDFERVLADKVKKDLLVLEKWEYVWPGGKKIDDKDADFQSFREWQDALVEFTFRDPPKIEPKKKRGRPRKSPEPAAPEIEE